MAKNKKVSFDVRTHVLVPKHAKLTQKDKNDLLKKLNITIKELPKISAKDPIIQPLNVTVGDVIKIVRPSPTAGEAVYYRCVVNE